MKKRLTGLLVLVFGAGFVCTGAAAQSLEEALVSAYQNNPTLQARRAKLRAVDEGVPQALSDWRPTVTMAGDAGVSAIRNPTGTDKGQHRDPRSMSLSVEQPLYRGGRTLAGTRKAEASVAAERQRLRSVEQSVLFDAVVAFNDVVRDQAILRLNINNEQVLRRQLEAARDRFEVGEVTRTDVHQAEARFSGATANRIQAEGNLEAARATYRAVVGDVPGALTSPPVPQDVPVDIKAAVSQALGDNPDVRAAEFDERAARDNIDLVKGELLPRLSLSGTAQRTYDASGEDTRSTSYLAELSLTVPLYQSGSVYSRLRAARQTAAQSREEIDAARRDAVETMTRAWETMQSARARIEALEAQATAADVALEGVKREAEVGSRTVLDVLDAEQERLDANVNLAAAQRDLVVAVYNVKSAIGHLTAERLGLPVEPYDPQRHYDEVRGKWFGGTSSGDGDGGK